jgi:hypothetical protein
MSGLPDERTGVLVVRLWGARTGSPGLVGRVSSTADLANTLRSEETVKGEADLRRVVEDWLDTVIGGTASNPANPPDA